MKLGWVPQTPQVPRSWVENVLGTSTCWFQNAEVEEARPQSLDCTGPMIARMTAITVTEPLPPQATLRP